MAYLIDCPTCARLIRGEEDACPFCGAAFRLPGTSTYVRAFGLVLGLMTASCGGDKPDDSTTLMTGAIYSASGITTTDTQTGTSTGTGTGTGTSTGSSGATTGVTDEPPGTASAAYAASSFATTDDSSGTDATGTGTGTDGTGTGSTGTGTGTTGTGTGTSG